VILRAALLATLASTAHADPLRTAPPPTPDERKAAARTAADAASVLFAAGDFAGALARFEEAMALRPNPKLHYNLGVCHQRLTREAAARDDPAAEARHASAAIDAFNAYLRGNPDAADLATVEALVRDLGGTPATQPQLRDPLAPLPTTPAPLPDPPTTPPTTPLPPAKPEPPLPRGYLGGALGLVTQPHLLDTANLDGGYQGVLLARGGARLGRRRGLELGAQLWLAVPGQTAPTYLALSTQALLVDVGYAVPLGPGRRLELPLGASFGVAREGLRVRAGQPLPTCAAATTGTLVAARPGGVAVDASGSLC
jgi:tetratricopeptide (TPR) repeat protein